jgi:hypothetical protein
MWMFGGGGVWRWMRGVPTATASSVSIRLSGLDTVIYTHARVLHIINCRLVLYLLTDMTTNEQTGTSTQKVQNVLEISSIYTFPSPSYQQSHKMVDQAPSGKKPLPDMMTSIRLDSSDKVEIVDQLLLP